VTAVRPPDDDAPQGYRAPDAAEAATPGPTAATRARSPSRACGAAPDACRPPAEGAPSDRPREVASGEGERDGAGEGKGDGAAGHPHRTTSRTHDRAAQGVPGQPGPGATLRASSRSPARLDDADRRLAILAAALAGRRAGALLARLATPGRAEAAALAGRLGAAPRSARLAALAAELASDPDALRERAAAAALDERGAIGRLLAALAAGAVHEPGAAAVARLCRERVTA
jgi:hypothetical protein